MVTAPLVEVSAVTPRSSLLRIDLSRTSFDFLPGQAVVIGAHGSPVRRPYSIACSPDWAAEHRQMELLVTVEPDGTLGPHLTPATAGSALDVDGPFGSFVFPAVVEQPRVLFVAGGTGIAPLRAMIDHALRRHPACRLSLLYSARRSDEFAFIDEFRRHALAGRLELHPTVTRGDGTGWAGRRGRIDEGHYRSVVHDPAQTLCFVCGPPLMVLESVETLRRLSVPEALIKTEQWGREE